MIYPCAKLYGDMSNNNENTCQKKPSLIRVNSTTLYHNMTDSQDRPIDRIISIWNILFMLYIFQQIYYFCDFWICITNKNVFPGQ